MLSAGVKLGEVRGALRGMKHQVRKALLSGRGALQAGAALENAAFGRDAGGGRSISGLVVEYIVAIDVTRVRFPADAFMARPRVSL